MRIERGSNIFQMLAVMSLVLSPHLDPYSEETSEKTSTNFFAFASSSNSWVSRMALKEKELGLGFSYREYPRL